MISYFPLIDISDYVPGETIDGSDSDAVKDLQRRFMDDHPSGRADGVIWSYYPFDINSVEEATAVIPIFMMDKANEIADHLNKWSENEMERRFDLYICVRSEGYAIILIPNIAESIRRWKAARLIYHEEFVELTNFEVIFSPLGAVCPQRTVYEQVKGLINNPTLIGFVDNTHINVDNPTDLDSALVKIVGPVGIKEPDDMIKQLIDDMFKGVIEDAKG